MFCEAVSSNVSALVMPNSAFCTDWLEQKSDENQLFASKEVIAPFKVRQTGSKGMCGEQGTFRLRYFPLPKGCGFVILASRLGRPACGKALAAEVC
eukprot:2974643-Pleurochrysis_carterae.AAC.2